MNFGLMAGILTSKRVSVKPTLSSPTDTAAGTTAATGTVITNNVSNGFLYWVVTTSATSPTSEQVIDGENHLGAAAGDSGSQAVSTIGLQTLSPAPSGLTASTAYWIHYVQAFGSERSNVASGNGFTTASEGGASLDFSDATNSQYFQMMFEE